MNRSLIFNSVDQGNNSKQRTLRNINPNVDRSTLAIFGEKIAALTNDTLSAVTSVDNSNLDNQNKRTPTISLGTMPTEAEANLRKANGELFLKVDVNYNGDGKLYIPVLWDESGTFPKEYEYLNDDDTQGVTRRFFDDDGYSLTSYPYKLVPVSGGKWQLWCDWRVADGEAHIIIKSTATDTCNAASLVF